MCLGLEGCKGPQSILDPAGPAALSISRLWWGMFIYFTLVFFVIAGFWFYAIKPRKKESGNKTLGQHLIVWGGIVFPTLSILILLAFGIPIGQSMLPHPEADDNILRIHVIGHQWFWKVHYPDRDVTLINELHLPLDRPVDIYATTHDVIHSFWVPKLNGKIDMIPGYTNIIRLKATELGQFRGQCAEFCGKWHAKMVLDVVVHPKEDFSSWLNSQNNSVLNLKTDKRSEGD
ncbi:cytochrome c oxidase subunit II [Legionella yabuuchiae]|uniref:cytochrome c oxidase subunit II n=1 Tax=Legionella yabuuchiae TaxID=376727 RepID=UPI00241556A6|nr:cytochrome c oxidase subunit II [Legionella yabuuchiae]